MCDSATYHLTAIVRVQSDAQSSAREYADSEQNSRRDSKAAQG